MEKADPVLGQPEGRRSEDAAEQQPAGPAGERPERYPGRRVPAWTVRTLAYSGAVLAVAAVCWLVGTVVLRLWLVSATIAVALLFTALLAPLTLRMRRGGLPAVLAALLSLILLVGIPAAVAALVWSRVSEQVEDLTPVVTQGIDDIRNWLTTGPLQLDPARVAELRNQMVSAVSSAVPTPVGGARTLLQLLTAVALGLFAVFFFLKEGEEMWRWLVRRVTPRHRATVDRAGRAAWGTLTGYVVGLTLVALADAVLIGTGLFFVGVPLWLSLALLTFVGAYVPILGATVAGAVAVLVTMVTNGPQDALIVLGIVLLVQQVEGNLLQPLVVGRAVQLHPVVALVAVTAGTLLLGITGALLAVPLTAVVYRVLAAVNADRS
ncbi:putative PurR-regulated permease PerM [Kineococcus xinjiangensis]|uniref:Putative PurR-regulated permease PerM n=1 Tax=Kineococcus xinjiangensis TaxID=512762 RepID=A0A2S6IFC6_9ACTN|nr:AI-2E family transporter [Kineococcus xinjiangensis]PPK92925.1 putative PurR-regulated permease PerM [Kineococcus xinjiangensis]